MAKKKERSRRAKAKARKAAANPIIRGKQAFHHSDYDEAIAAWEEAYQKSPAAPVTTALAEAYFRRGLMRFYRYHQHEAGLSDLDKAACLVQGDPRYAYHLGLAHHHQGNLDTALMAYRLALDADPAFTRAAELAILAALEQGRDPTQEATWKALPANRQAELRPLAHLVLRQLVVVEPGGATPVGVLWQGLAALESGDACSELGRGGDALSILQGIAQDNNQPAAVRAVAAYALGMDALRHHRPTEALAHWEAACHLGLDTPTFRDNLHQLYYTSAEQAMADGQWAQAAALADAALNLWPNDHDLRDLAAAAHFHAGHADAQAARWDQALEHWEKARELGENSRALIQNLALACEKEERFQEAAELWREVLRRRPRRAGAPDALTPHQVALLWGHVAECYHRAGDVEEAITTLRNAVKNDPSNTDLRLELVDALIANQQWSAASNEVNRIIKREPNNIGALVRSGRLDEAYGYLYRARQTWKKVVALDPTHLEARERLVELLHQEGDRLCRYGDFDKAVGSYREALQYMPNESYLYISLAECYFYKNDPQAARQEMERAFALDSTDLDVYHMAVDACHIVSRPDDAEWVITQAEERAGPQQPAGHLPAIFFLDLAHCCFRRGQTKLGNDYVRRAEQRAEGDPDSLVHIALFHLDHRNEGRAIDYLRQALRLDPEHGWANLHMGSSYAVALEMREARRHWRQARRTARRTGDEELLQAVELARQTFERAIDMLERGAPPFDTFGGLDIEMVDYDDDEYW